MFACICFEKDVGVFFFCLWFLPLFLYFLFCYSFNVKYWFVLTLNSVLYKKVLCSYSFFCMFFFVYQFCLLSRLHVSLIFFFFFFWNPIISFTDYILLQFNFHLFFLFAYNVLFITSFFFFLLMFELFMLFFFSEIFPVFCFHFLESLLVVKNSTSLFFM